jgi:hypothetical protein
MKVEQKQMIVQSGHKDNQTEIVRIPKDLKENPRKVWSYAKDSETKQFRLYIEFGSGRLVCYSVDGEKNSYE